VQSIKVTTNIAKITRSCPTRPCYEASVQVTVPPTPPPTTAPDAAAAAAAAAAEAEQVVAGPYIYTTFINSNRDTVVQHDTASMVAPCL
jgi:hypothetical protein